MNGRTKLAPGVYRLGDEIHFDLPELLAARGLPCTPANQRAVIEGARAALRSLNLVPSVEVRDRCPSCLGRGWVAGGLRGRTRCRRCRGSGEVRVG